MAEYIEREDLEFPYMTTTLWGLNRETCHAYNEGVKAAADYIAARPAADVAPVVHGQWERYVDDKFSGYDANGKLKYRKVYTYECSNCGRSAAIKTNYCPNCGANMQGGQQ